MKKPSGRIVLLFAVLLLGMFGCSLTERFFTRDVPRMQAEDLKSRLNDPALVLIDVRSYDDWSGSTVKIKGAVRELGGDESAWAPRYPKDKTIVLYCA